MDKHDASTMTTRIDQLSSHVVYSNPMPHVRSRHGFFPGLVQLPGGQLLAFVAIGEAFESADMTTHLLRSADRGRSWQLQGAICDKATEPIPTSDYLKPQILRDGTLIGLGYRFHRLDPEQPISIVRTDGLLPGDNVVCFSSDQGRTWSAPRIIERSTPELVEIPHGPIQLPSGDIVVSAGLMKMPDGSNPSGQYGLILRSRDGGANWNDEVRFFQSASRTVAAFESGIARLSDGRLVTICWAYDTAFGRDHANQVSVSHDAGYTWSEPIDTGHMAQSSGLLALDGQRVMSIHCHRGQEVGLFVRVVDLSDDRWNVITESCIWGAQAGGQVPDSQTFETMIRKIRFGQPSLVQLDNGEILAAHWAIIEGQGQVLAHRLRLVD